MAGVIARDYNQQLTQDILGPTQNDPARRAYLLRQAGLAGPGGLMSPDFSLPTSSTGTTAPRSSGVGYRPDEIFHPATGSFSPKPSASAGIPTFAPPATGITPSQAITSQPDPKIQALLTQLSAQSESDAVPSANGPQISDLERQIRETTDAFGSATSKNTAQSAQLQALLSQLMKGEGINIGPVNNDPEAQAFRVAKLRESERARESEAARLGASGITGSGDFDARVGQINEAAGTDIAGFEANLMGKRRKEATQTALSGANLQLADLDRQRQDTALAGSTKLNALQNLLNTLMESDARRASLSTQSRQQLLAQLFGEQGRVQGSATNTAQTSTQDAFEAERLRMEQERQRQATEDWQRQRARSGGSMVGGIVAR